MAVNTLTLSEGTEIRSFPPQAPFGLVPFRLTHKFNANSEFTVADDAVVLGGPFPSGSLLPTFFNSLRIVVPSELDSHATPALVFDLFVSPTNDGESTNGTVLINDSTAGQADNGDDDLDAADGPYIDIGGMYLVLKCVTAPATDDLAGNTVEVAGVYCRGVQDSDDSLITQTW